MMVVVIENGADCFGPSVLLWVRGICIFPTHYT